MRDRPRPSGPVARAPLTWSAAEMAVALVLLVPPFLVAPEAKESFRLVKVLVSGFLALLSLHISIYSPLHTYVVVCI